MASHDHAQAQGLISSAIGARPGAASRASARRLMPGINIGVSVDQSRTTIDVPLAMQSATLDLTQFGFNASVDKGPWTWASRWCMVSATSIPAATPASGNANAGYNAQIDGALTELDYYWTKDQSRIVPKAALEYVRATTGSFQEVGGLDPLMASASDGGALAPAAGRGGRPLLDLRPEDLRPVRLRQVRRQFRRRTSARSWSASARKASRSRASAKASMAPTPVPRLRSASPTPRGSISTMTASSAPTCSRTRPRSAWS